MNTISLVQNWYKNQCNGDWEHSNGIVIETIDNPGWRVTIDLADTQLANISSELIELNKSDDDWYFYHIKDEKFVAAGDPSKLDTILAVFCNLVGLKV